MSASDELDVNVTDSPSEIDFFGANEVVIPLSITLPDGRTPLQGTWTADDWEQLDHSRARYEIIEGVLYTSKSPSILHEYVLVYFTSILFLLTRQKKLGWCFSSRSGIFMPNVNPVQPDFSFVRRDRTDIALVENRVYGVPDLIVEVLSSNRSYDEKTKYRLYAEVGVPEYGILDLDKRRLDVHSQPKDGKYQVVKTFTGDDAVRFACLPNIDLGITLTLLFEDAPDV